MGSIVYGALAPHPPHLVYAENPRQNAPRSEGGWEMLRWGYERMRRDLSAIEYDTLVVLSPHWQTYIGTHFLGVPHFESLSVDPVFPNLFRYRYDLDVDVALAEQICGAASAAGLVTKMMRNPDFRVDYGTIVSCHLTNPNWDKPIVGISSQRSAAFYSVEVMQEQMLALGRATREAIEAADRRVVLLASESLSHRHFVTEGPLPEDMSREHVTNHHQYLWDMRLIEMMRTGRTREIVDIMPEFTEQAVSESDSGALTWLMAAMGFPTYPAEVYAYGTVIGTGNAVVGWDLRSPPQAPAARASA
jgi:2-aminophenol/2-amino-5-chlorophenol 1,6-dioxygenase subunit beta